MGEFDNTIAVVTGTTGIGRAIALHLARQGASVVSLGIDVAANAELTEFAATEGLPLVVLHADVSVPENVREVMGEVVSRFGGLDIIVNSAAIHPYGDATSTPFDLFLRCMAVNVGSIHLTAEFGVPEMRKRGGGAIINISSVQGHACQTGVSAYVASKGAIHALTRAMAVDFAPTAFVSSLSAPAPSERLSSNWPRAHSKARMPISTTSFAGLAKPTRSAASASPRRSRHLLHSSPPTRQGSSPVPTIA
jgi:NAD(P)-dependent dehydrogenase (short-subunit alcohol dehydrogenase family)